MNPYIIFIILMNLNACTPPTYANRTGSGTPDQQQFIVEQPLKPPPRPDDTQTSELEDNCCDACYLAAEDYLWDQMEYLRVVIEEYQHHARQMLKSVDYMQSELLELRRLMHELKKSTSDALNHRADDARLRD